MSKKRKEPRRPLRALGVNVSSLMTPKNRTRAWTKVIASSALAILAILFLRSGQTAAQNFPAVVGRIEGDDLEVVTTTPVGVEINAAPTDVASGSEVTVRSGHALLLLNAGGEVSVCGPAHFKLIKSSQNVTLALDYGRVHPTLESADTFTIYTPTIVATPIAISGGRRDMTVDLEQNGEMCVLTSRGAMRVEPQFSDQSTIIPQGDTVSLAGGQIKSLQADASACSCDYPRAKLEQPKGPKARQTPSPASTTPREVSALKHPIPPEPTRTEKSAPPAAPKEGPVYTFLMPPLSFNASAPEPPPDPDPETILLVREVRLRPAAVFHGRVKPSPSQTAAAAAAPMAPRVSDDPPKQTQPGLMDRVRSFFHKFS